jgi:hypothetical protein
LHKSELEFKIEERQTPRISEGEKMKKVYVQWLPQKG